MRQHRTSSPVRTVWIAACATLMFSATAASGQDAEKKPAEDSATTPHSQDTGAAPHAGDPGPAAPHATSSAPTTTSAGYSRDTSDRDDDALLDSPSGADKRFLQLQLGLRSMYVTDPGYDPFSEHDALVSVGAAVSYPVWISGNFSVAPFALWDYGEVGATARSKATSLSVHRLEAGLEGRYHFTWWLFAYVHVAPGALSQSMAVNDETESTELKQSVWRFALDSAAGAAVLLGPRWARAKFRLWAFGEGGYSWSDNQSTVLTPAARDDQAPVGDLPLGRLALRGGHFRIGLAVTY